MKDLFQNMFRYHHHFNQKLIGEMQLHESKLPTRTMPLFSHILNAHQIWNSRIQKTPSLGVRDEHTLARCIDIDSKNFEDTMKILESIDLQMVVNYKNTSGEDFSNIAKDILFHIVNHTTHHRGQIVSDFRQAGIAPIVTDYIFFKRG